MKENPFINPKTGKSLTDEEKKRREECLKIAHTTVVNSEGIVMTTEEVDKEKEDLKNFGRPER